MSDSEDLNNLRAIGMAAAADADNQLRQELMALRQSTGSQLQTLKPLLSTDDATFFRLVQVVEEATASNMSIAEFTNRLKTLGTNVLTVARTASNLLPLT